MPTLSQLKQTLGSQPVTGYAPPKQNILQKAVGGVKGIAKDALNTLVVNPGVKIGQAIAYPFAMGQANQSTANQEAYVVQAQAALNQYKKETDPTKKATLHQQAVDYLNKSTQAGQSGTQAFQALAPIEQGTRS